MKTSDMQKLQLLCAFIRSKGVNNADTKAAADGLEASLVGVPDTTVNEKESSEPSTGSSGGLRLVDLVLKGVLELARNFETALSTATGGLGQNGLGRPEDLKQHLYYLAVTFTAVAGCWEHLAGKDDESHKLAVATAATTSGAFDTLSAVSKNLTTHLSNAPDNVNKKLARSIYLKLAVSIISLWHNFSNHWTTSSSVLVGSDMALFSQSVTSLIHLLLRVLNKAMQSSAAASNDQNLLSAFSTAMDGCLASARCIARNYVSSTTPDAFYDPEESRPAAVALVRSFNLHEVLAKDGVPVLFALGAGYHIWMLRKRLQHDILFDNGIQKLSVPALPRTLDGFKELLKSLQLTALGAALVKYFDTAWYSEEPFRQQGLQLNALFSNLVQAGHPKPPNSESDWQPQVSWFPNEDDNTALDVISGIASVCDLVGNLATNSESADQQQQQQQISQWLVATSPLLVLLRDLQLSTSEVSRETIATAQSYLVTLSFPVSKALNALNAVIAIWNLQLCQTNTLFGAAAAAAATANTQNSSSNSSSQYKQIITSMAALEESIRSAAAVRYFAWQLLKEQASRVVSILAAHGKQLQGVSATLDKSVWSLTLTCLKLAQAYSALRTADAAVLAQHMLKASLQLFPQQAGTASQATAQQQKSSHAAKQSAQHVNFTLMMISRISSTIGTILQHTGRNATSNRYKQELKHTQLSSVLAVAAQLSPWLETAVSRVCSSSLPPQAEDLLTTLRQQLQKLDAADDQAAADAPVRLPDVSDTAVTDQSQDTPTPAGCHAKGLALARLGAALSSEFPVPYCCNNPDCVNMALESELMLVRQKGSMCSACQKARYCSKARSSTGSSISRCARS